MSNLCRVYLLAAVATVAGVLLAACADGHPSRGRTLVERARAVGARADSTAAPGATPPPAVFRLAGEISDRMRRGLDADALHASALIDLHWATGTAASLRRPVAALNGAVRLDPANAHLLADLATASRRLGLASDDPILLLAGVDAAARAARLRPDDGEVRRALRLVRRSAGLDGNPDRQQRAPSDSLWQVILPAWAAARLQSDADAQRAALQALDAHASRTAPDQAPVRLRKELDAACAVPARCAALAQALAALSRGRAALTFLHLDSAEAALRSARRALGSSATARAEAELQLGLVAIHRGARHAGELRLAQLLPYAREHRLLAIAARIAWASGTVALRDGRLEQARAHYRSALAEYVALRDDEGTNAMLTLTADVDLLTGRRRDAMRRLFEVAGRVRADTPSVRRHSVMILLGRESAASGFTAAADLFLMESLRAASSPPQAGDRGESFALIAENAATMRDAGGYGAAISRLRALQDSIVDPVDRAWIRASVQLLDGEHAASASPLQAVAMLDSTLEYQRRIGFRLGAFRALMARGTALHALGRLHPAAAAFDSALQLAETERNALGRQPEAVRTFARARRAVERFVRTEALDQRNLQEALQTLRRSRRLAAVHGTRAAPPTPPRGQIGLTLARIDDRLLAFIESDGQLRLETSTIDTTVLARSIATLGELLQADADSSMMLPILRRLHGMLLPKTLPTGAMSATTLLLDTDGLLDAVPFALLRDPATGKFLIERFVIRHAGPAGRSAPSRHRTQFAVTDPAFTATDEPLLPRLTATSAEVKTLRRLWPETAVLEQGDATRPRVLAALRTARRFHFGGHAVSERGRPDLARLVVAPSDGERGSITALDLAAERLDGLELAVLAACGSAASDDAVAIRSIGDAFLISGAARVVGSLWAVDDRATSQLMTSFYEALHRGAAPELALQQAQLTALRSGQLSMAHWGAWRVMGN